MSELPVPQEAPPGTPRVATAPAALMCGLVLLIPLPWVDEYLERRVTRGLLRDVARARGVELDDAALDALVEDRTSVAAGIAWAILKWPFKKLFRTVFFVLAAKDSVDAVARAAHRAALVDLAAAEGALPGRAAEVRRLMDDVLVRHRVSPVTRPLWRQERPPLPAPGPDDALHAFVHFLQRHGGGGVVLPAFRERLERTP